MVVSAKGRYLDSKQKWLVAEQLGEGACGTVHALHYQSKSASSNNNTQFAVKLAIEPPPSTNKKRKKTLVEKNADLLNHEHILYRNVLNNLRGTMIPDIPMASYSSIKTPPQGFGSIDGFRFLIMERMQAPFSSIVSSICSSSTTEIDIGPIGQRLIRLMEAIHDTHYLFVDVKPDNFMLCAPDAVKKTKSKKKSSEIESFAERIRMIDFGLLESNKDVMNNKHRANQHPDGQLVGTPVYASLNVLNGHTVSRRDDIEACVYVLMEFILQITACSQGNRDLEDLLPWSKARSDEEIRKMKEDALDAKGDIWDMLAQNGNKLLSKNVKEAFKIVRSMEFKDKPDYEGLCKMVAKWSVLTDFKKKKSRSGSKKASSTSTTSKRKARNSRESDDDVKVAASPPKRAHTDDLPEDSPSYEFDEDVPPTTSLTSRAARAAARSAAKEKADDEVVVVDSTPTKSTRIEKLKKELKEAKSTIASLEEKVLEKELDEAHSRISDLQDQLSEKEDGVSIIDIEMESMDDNDNENNSSAANSAEGMDWEVVSTTSNTSKKDSSWTSNTSKKDSSLPLKKKQSLKLECIQGPHQGEIVELSDVLVLGSNPSNKKGGHTFSLSKDDEACASHTKLVLNRSGSKKNPVLMVKVFDLKSKNGTMINSKVLPSGASRQAFIKDRIQVGSSVFRVMKE